MQITKTAIWIPIPRSKVAPFLNLQSEPPGAPSAFLLMLVRRTRRTSSLLRESLSSVSRLWHIKHIQTACSFFQRQPMCKSLHINALHTSWYFQVCIYDYLSKQPMSTNGPVAMGQFQSPKRIAAVLTACFRDIFLKQHSMIVCAHNVSLMLPGEQKTHISHPSSLLPPCGNSRASLGAGLPWATRWIDPSELRHLGALSLVRWMAGTGRDVEPHQGRRQWSWMPLDQRHGDHGYAALPGPKPNCSPLTLRPWSKHEFYGHQRSPVDWN